MLDDLDGILKFREESESSVAHRILHNNLPLPLQEQPSDLSYNRALLKKSS